MVRLEPLILKHLKEKKRININALIKDMSVATDVDVKKIKKRVNKMISQNKISLSGETVSPASKEEPLGDFDELFEHGPIRIGRKGREVSVQSNWDEKEYEDYLKKVEENLPEFKKNISNKIKNIEKMVISKFDPLDALAYVSTQNLMYCPEQDTESSFAGKQLYSEIIQNIILKNNQKVYKEKENRGDLPELDEYLQGIENDITWEIINSVLIDNKLTKIEKDILVRALFDFIFIRGDAYPIHYRMVGMELFNIIKEELEKKGFNIEQYYETVEEIERQVNSNFNKPIGAAKEEHKRFIEFCKKEEEKGTNSKEILELYKNNLEKRKESILPDITKISEMGLKGCFEIEINNKINKNLLDQLSLEFGYNPSWNGYLDKSEISLKPIIKSKNKYYCFIVSNLIRNVVQVIESLFTKEDMNKIKYSQKKGKYFENKVVELFKNKLKSAKIYQGLHYKVLESGEEKWPEIDCIIIYKDNLVLIEVKGKTKRGLEGRNDVLTIIEGDLKKNVSEAFNQTKRAYDFITGNRKSIFEMKRGEPFLEIEKEKYKNIFLLNVTSESFSTFSTDLNSLKLFRQKLLEGDIYPYIVNIYDLQALMDLLNEGDFIDYLKQRIYLSKSDELKSGDELDLLGYYLTHGSLSKTEDIQKIQTPLIHGYSEEIDKWYSHLDGKIKFAKKPTKKN